MFIEVDQAKRDLRASISDVVVLEVENYKGSDENVVETNLNFV